MKINWKTLLQALIISIIVITLLSVFLFYPMLNSIMATNSQGIASTLETPDDPFTNKVVISLIYVSVFCFIASTATFYFVINDLKNRNK